MLTFEEAFNSNKWFKRKNWNLWYRKINNKEMISELGGIHLIANISISDYEVNDYKIKIEKEEEKWDSMFTYLNH